jgi:NTE family protein
LQRLNELGVLSQIDTIVSVSGGSILNGVLAMAWNQLQTHDGVFQHFEDLVARPTREFCRQDLRTKVLLWNRVNPVNWPGLIGDHSTATDLLADAYAEGLHFDEPMDGVQPNARFVFCACNLETGVNWEFTLDGNQAEMGDYLTGRAPTGEVTVAQAVAASSAFPVAFPPLVLSFENPDVFQGGAPSVSRDMLFKIALTDGGVYDNLGLEPVWKSSEVVLVSDAGAPFTLVDEPGHGLVARLKRSNDIITNQTRVLRKRWLINMFQHQVLTGAYWGIGTDFENYGLAEARGYSPAQRAVLEGVRTDLDAFSDGEIGCLENHGYALADAALRRWLADTLDLRDAAFAWPSEGFSPEHAQAVSDALSGSGEHRVIKDLWKSALERARGWFS